MSTENALKRLSDWTMHHSYLDWFFNLFLSDYKDQVAPYRSAKNRRELNSVLDIERKLQNYSKYFLEKTISEDNVCSEFKVVLVEPNLSWVMSDYQQFMPYYLSHASYLV